MKTRLIPLCILILLFTAGCRNTSSGYSEDSVSSESAAPVQEPSDVVQTPSAFPQESETVPQVSETVPQETETVNEELVPSSQQVPEDGDSAEIHWYNDSLGYKEADGRCYITEDGGETFAEIITRETAAAYALEEAQKECYQYQPWESKFTIPDGPSLLVELMTKKDIYMDWSYAGWINYRYFWEIRLVDENDPLTSLILYMDVFTGTIAGASQLSD